MFAGCFACDILLFVIFFSLFFLSSSCYGCSVHRCTADVYVIVRGASILLRVPAVVVSSTAYHARIPFPLRDICSLFSLFFAAKECSTAYSKQACGAITVQSRGETILKCSWGHGLGGGAQSDASPKQCTSQSFPSFLMLKIDAPPLLPLPLPPNARCKLASASFVF